MKRFRTPIEETVETVARLKADYDGFALSGLICWGIFFSAIPALWLIGWKGEPPKLVIIASVVGGLGAILFDNLRASTAVKLLRKLEDLGRLYDADEG